MDTANNASFVGIFDVDSFLNYSISNNFINSQDFLENMSIIGSFKSGSYETIISYTLVYDRLFYYGG